MAGETSADALPPPPMYDLVGSLRPKSSESEHGTIIRDVSLRCESGEMMAMQVVCLLLPYLELIYSLRIGGSGSGKTTLLHALVGRLANLPVTAGQVKYEPAGISLSAKESVALSARKMKDRIGFVRQHDYLLEHLTVRETLDYAAALRLPSSISSSTRRLIVDQTIRELGLGDAADTVGISGGERRRLTIALSLISLPSILALDEPTTGLDAFTAYALLQTLSSLARKGRTVIMSVHQPRSDAWELFDRIVVLSKGDVVFAGRREKCLGWFEDMGMGSPGDRTEGCEDVAEKGSINVEADGGTGVNPLDWLIDICSVDPRDQSSIQRVTRLIQGWKDGGKVIADEHSPSRQSGILSDVIQRVPSVQPQEQDVLYANVQQNEDQPGSRPQALERPGWIRQTVVLTSRATKGVFRDYAQLLGFACQSIGIAVLLGITFLRLGESPSDIQSLKFCETDLVIFDREREDHLYQVVPWLISEYTSTLPLHTISSGLFAIILYFLTNMRTEDLAANLFIFIAECVLVQLGTVGFALLAASLQRTYAQASLMANGLSIFFLLTVICKMLLSGKERALTSFERLITHQSNFVIGQFRSIMYVFARWFPLAPNPNSPQYGFRAVAISQFKNRTFACPGVEGAARNQCDGNQVLTGLRIPVDHVVGYYFAGLVYKPGGTRYARKIDPSDAGKGPAVHSDMDISRQRIDVEVRNLGLKWIKTGLVTRKKTEKRILNDVHAVFPSGQVTAILGPSGAGKSTLLQLLASRKMNAGVGSRFESQGEILFNGRPVNKNIRDQVAFVEQEDDYHLPALTASFFSIVLHVRETLRYAAILRLPKGMSRKSKIARAEEVMKMLGLDLCADNLVGGELLKQGISGGEKRRLSLAVQMINDPAILIVDEPTSGLDALTANNVMTALNDIARSGRTIILSIHQPRSDIYVDKLDNIILLVKGGEVAYAGPRSEVGPTLTSAGHPIPPLYNPADWLLDLASVDLRRDREEATRERVAKLVKRWANTHREMKELDLKDREEDLVQVGGPEERFTPMWIALPLIVDRMTKNLQVNSSPHSIHKTNVMQVETASRLQQLPFLGVLFLLFYQRLKHGPSGGQDRIGYFQEMVSPVAFVGLLNCIAIFPKDRDLYFHEYRSSAAYSEATFVLGFTLVALPMEILASLLFTVITNIGAGMQTSPRIFFEYAFSIFALQSMGEFWHDFCLHNEFSGVKCIVGFDFYHRLSDIAYATTMKYAARVIAVNESVGLKLHCSPETVQSGECLVQSGQELLDLLGFSNNLKTGRYLGILVALALAYRVLAWFFVVLKIRRG
ncbi:P-loop containing nucleoside triphosphate hydrolase protein [Rhizoctonia solani]|uniref:P-loop containing nucleoside triphosphate hydrolase protein n=1 Tax=Rhizoctonia solani TaxID=456999 RepID=A0A8H7LZ88_9AGAM|nr:P-loop containing nucleoside triphosphate hydrolase protein [Rhizoctonia solani]